MKKKYFLLTKINSFKHNIMINCIKFMFYGENSSIMSTKKYNCCKHNIVNNCIEKVRFTRKSHIYIYILLTNINSCKHNIIINCIKPMFYRKNSISCKKNIHNIEKYNKTMSCILIGYLISWLPLLR